MIKVRRNFDAVRKTTVEATGRDQKVQLLTRYQRIVEDILCVKGTNASLFISNRDGEILLNLLGIEIDALAFELQKQDNETLDKLEEAAEA